MFLLIIARVADACDEVTLLSSLRYNVSPYHSFRMRQLHEDKTYKSKQARARYAMSIPLRNRSVVGSLSRFALRYSVQTFYTAQGLQRLHASE